MQVILHLLFDLAKTYLETRVAHLWQNVVKSLELENKDSKDWINFKEALIKAYGNINPEHLVRTKLGSLIQTSSMENYANKFYNLCAEITTLSISIGDKIHHFIIGLKPEIRMSVAMDPLNNAQPWEDFQRLITYVVFVDANLQQMKGLTFEKMEKKVPNSIGVGGPIKAQKKSTMKFSNGREVDYKEL